MKKFLLLLIISNFLFFNTTSFISQNENKNTKSYPTEGIIIIKKINLYHSFRENSNVDKDIIVINNSKYPNENDSILILAAHSGTGKYAFFKYLYKLKKGDEATIIYDGKKYFYKLIDYYNEKKDGTVKVKRIKNTKTLALITCTFRKKDLQTIYIFKIIE